MDWDPPKYLFARAAADVDNYLLGRQQHLPSVKRIQDILEKEKLTDQSNGITADMEFYLPLWKTIRSEVPMKTIADLAVQMRLFEMELAGAHQASEEKLKQLRSFLVDASKAYPHQIGIHKYIA